MNYRQLENCDLKLSEIGLGCASYWGKKSFSEPKAIDVVHRAIERGVNYFDTGHSYSGGYAEVRLGKALQQKNHDSKLVVSTKVGTRVGSYGRLYKDFSPQWITQSCEQSLRQLKLDHIPILFLHGPNPEDFNDDTYQALAALQQTGKVGVLAVNSFADEIIQMAADSRQFQCIMLDHNILSQHRKNTIEQLNKQHIDVVVAGAIAGGLYDRRFKQFRGLKSVWYWLRALKNNRSLVKKAKHFDFLNKQQNATAVQLALAYVLDNTFISSALIGTTSVAHLDELLDTTTACLDAQLVQLIEAKSQLKP